MLLRHNVKPAEEAETHTQGHWGKTLMHMCSLLHKQTSKLETFWAPGEQFSFKQADTIFSIQFSLIHPWVAPTESLDLKELA